jgi:hypothetical protein
MGRSELNMLSFGPSNGSALTKATNLPSIGNDAQNLRTILTAMKSRTGFGGQELLLVTI